MLPDLKSLAARLFKLVFGWYLLLAILVTAVQLGIEYASIRSTIAVDLAALGRSFSPGVSDALWTYDRELLNSLARGINQAAIVSGVKIEDMHGEVLAAEGHIPGGPPSDALLAPFQVLELPLRSPVLIDGHAPRQLGRLSLYSDRGIVVDRVKYSFIVILINSIVKTAGLWLIFHWAITWKLSRPLRELSAAVSKVDFAAEDDEAPLLAYPHRDEIGTLVTSLNEMRERLRQRGAEVKRANKELEDFSYSMSHDLRTPLRALDGYSKILVEEHCAGLDADGRRLLGEVRRNAQRMGRQMNDMLHFLQLGRQKMECGAVDLAGMAAEIFSELQAEVPQRCLRLQLGELPRAWGDGRMLRLALRHLLSNAVKFTPPEREAVVELSCVPGAGEDVYTVRDKGIGFDGRYADKLFQVFEHVNSTCEYDGNGMGLAMVRRIIERHGGRVWAEGTVGQGASFHFALPHAGVGKS
ncbi:MAG TPA: ATP-binding protein [Rhodocyclaceae bacterium]